MRNLLKLNKVLMEKLVMMREFRSEIKKINFLLLAEADGFGLAEVLIAIAIFSVLLFSGMGLVEFFIKFSLQQKAAADKIEVIKLVENALQTNCTCNFTSGPIKYSGSGDINFNEIKFFKSGNCLTPASGGIFVNQIIAHTLTGLKVAQFKINNIYSPQANRYQGDLRIEYVTDKIPIGPTQTFSRPFNFSTLATTGVIDSCSFGGSGDSDSSSMPGGCVVTADYPQPDNSFFIDIKSKWGDGCKKDRIRHTATERGVGFVRLCESVAENGFQCGLVGVTSSNFLASAGPPYYHCNCVKSGSR